MKSQFSSLGWFIVALLLGALCGWVDLHATEVQGVVLMILVFTAALGFLHPAGAWRWALMIGCSILAAHLVRRALGYSPPYPVKPNVLATLLALIPAFSGTYAGVAARFVFAGGGEQ